MPAQYLGSRWSLAYYSILGVLDLVAGDAEEYVGGWDWAVAAIPAAAHGTARHGTGHRTPQNPTAQASHGTEHLRRYVEIALRMGMEPRARAEVQQRIAGNMHKMFHQRAAVDAWTDIFLRMAHRADEKRRKAAGSAAAVQGSGRPS